MAGRGPEAIDVVGSEGRLQTPLCSFLPTCEGGFPGQGPGGGGGQRLRPQAPPPTSDLPLGPSQVLP